MNSLGEQSSKDLRLSLRGRHACRQPFLHQDFHVVVASAHHHFLDWLIDLLIALGVTGRVPGPPGEASLPLKN